jgi:putative effector of murein hydrolase
MKEATGEASLTVVAIILIGIIVAVVTPIVNEAMQNTKARTDCINNGGVWEDGQCNQ